MTDVSTSRPTGPGSRSVESVLSSPLVRVKSHKIVKYDSGISGSVTVYKFKTIYYAVKVYFDKQNYETNKEYKERVLHEYEVLHKLSHINIIDVYKYSVSVLGKIKLFQQAGSCNIYSLLKKVSLSRLDKEEIYCIWKQIVLAITYMHHNDWCHRDIKLQNLVFDPLSGLVKLIDFVTAVNLPSHDVIGLVGSENYCSPEMYSDIHYDGFKSDIWSLGICLYQLLTKQLPWKMAKLEDSKYDHYRTTGSLPGEFAPPVELALKAMLTIDVDKRVSADGINEFLWFRAIDSCDGVHRCKYDHIASFNIKF